MYASSLIVEQLILGLEGFEGPRLFGELGLPQRDLGWLDPDQRFNTGRHWLVSDEHKFADLIMFPGILLSEGQCDQIWRNFATLAKL